MCLKKCKSVYSTAIIFYTGKCVYATVLCILKCIKTNDVMFNRFAHNPACL